jgi:hypothetical protein
MTGETFPREQTQTPLFCGISGDFASARGRKVTRS